MERSIIAVLTFAATALLALWLSELLARRQADARADLLRAHLDDAISEELDQYEQIQRLSENLHSALIARNAANLRAARAANSLIALPPVQVGCPLPAERVRLVPYSLN